MPSPRTRALTLARAILGPTVTLVCERRGSGKLAEERIVRLNYDPKKATYPGPHSAIGLTANEAYETLANWLSEYVPATEKE